MSQIRRADEAVFALLAKHTGGGIKRVGGKRPLDDFLDLVMSHRDYNLTLQPLPSAPPQPWKRSAQDQPSGTEALSRKQRRRAAQHGEASQPKGDWHKGGGDWHKGGGKGHEGQRQDGQNKKGRSKGKSASIPNELRYPGVSAQDGEGSPICFTFNIKGWDAAPPGGRCNRGKHVCALATCRGAHGFLSHHHPK